MRYRVVLEFYLLLHLNQRSCFR
uniref:Uncharacterized protein n=1 Tax=Arundo donax TaxID=35708 RepID=A0A0A8YU57_ARUDO